MEFSVDMKNYITAADKYTGCIDYKTTGQNKPYIFAMFWWTYTLDDFPGYVFATTGIESKLASNLEWA